jgi:hypothetical protein
LRWPGSRRP